MGSNIIFHIGLHKTASSYLQRSFFPRIQSAMLIDNMKSFSSQWENQVGECNEYMIFSNERFSGSPWKHKTRYHPPQKSDWLKSFQKNIDAIKVHFPNAIILVFFRPHGSFLWSLYCQYLQEGGTIMLDDFFGKSKFIEPNSLSYKYRIEYLKERFENVYLMDFNDFKDNGDQYLGDFFLNEFQLEYKNINLKKNNNVSISGRGIEVCRKMNYAYNRFPVILKKGLQKFSLHPRGLLQEKLTFINNAELKAHLDFKNEVNELFIEDWNFFLQNKYHT